ncbi:hypothetical protein N802_13640 [Knoellia sinensis KCTC 19936]|uniref:Uncharacterized protein n=1 Tax=Knoellia sinensis KCTC 19936 TaxID=1385520 RepID=A0A0A0IW67_9MICO|nr:hypothetical protein [Knoellia sinensis]KGN29455.1 hypothetical protein N802_13640 [Knoellia sinensis KCTC 19936]
MGTNPIRQDARRRLQEAQRAEAIALSDTTKAYAARARVQKRVDVADQDIAAARSQKLVYVDEQRRAGNHICIVDDLGIADLLGGRRASCRRSRLLHDELIEVSGRSLEMPRS